MQTISLDTIRTDGGTQPRAQIDALAIAEYAEAMRGGAAFPPLVVFEDKEGERWLADGFHRLAAARQVGSAELPCHLHHASRRDAVLYACGANTAHGLRRTNSDKRRAVLVLLQDDEWAQWSDREIGRQCRVSNRFVSNLRSDVTVNGSQSGKRKGADGRTIDTANIGRKPTEQDAVPAELFEAEPPPVVVGEDEARKVAREAGRRERKEREASRVYNLKERSAKAEPEEFNVIVADPPWKYSNSGVEGSAEGQYPTQTVDEIIAQPEAWGVRFMGEAVLYLWATNPLLPDALKVLDGWGFTYRTNKVWVKDRATTGFWLLGQHELVLIASRGKFRPFTDKLPRSVLHAPVREHSRKPDALIEEVETLYPECKYAELWARTEREGWACRGNETGKF